MENKIQTRIQALEQAAESCSGDREFYSRALTGLTIIPDIRAGRYTEAREWFTTLLSLPLLYTENETRETKAYFTAANDLLDCLPN